LRLRKVAVDSEVQHLVAIYIAVMIRGGDSLRVIVVFARNETANDEVASLKCLMHGRRLMYPACDRLKVMDRKR
jgi:hypothetical protein